MDGFGDLDGFLTGALVYAALVVAVAWLAMIVWTYRDMRARSRDGFVTLLLTALVALLNLPGIIVYLFLRPRETLAEAYERSLEEEALLQEIEEKPACPGCRARVQRDWQLCPHCHTRLKRPCLNCGRMLDLAWEICPHCAAGQPTVYTSSSVSERRTALGAVPVASSAREGRPQSPEEQARRRPASALEFIDGEDA